MRIERNNPRGDIEESFRGALPPIPTQIHRTGGIKDSRERRTLERPGFTASAPGGGASAVSGRRIAAYAYIARFEQGELAMQRTSNLIQRAVRLCSFCFALKCARTINCASGSRADCLACCIARRNLARELNKQTVQTFCGANPHRTTFNLSLAALK